MKQQPLIYFTCSERLGDGLDEKKKRRKKSWKVNSGALNLVVSPHKKPKHIQQSTMSSTKWMTGTWKHDVCLSCGVLHPGVHSWANTNIQQGMQNEWQNTLYCSCECIKESATQTHIHQKRSHFTNRREHHFALEHFECDCGCVASSCTEKQSAQGGGNTRWCIQYMLLDLDWGTYSCVRKDATAASSGQKHCFSTFMYALHVLSRFWSFFFLIRKEEEQITNIETGNFHKFMSLVRTWP